jgi:hypothetical protein
MKIPPQPILSVSIAGNDRVAVVALAIEITPPCAVSEPLFAEPRPLGVAVQAMGRVKVRTEAVGAAFVGSMSA